MQSRELVAGRFEIDRIAGAGGMGAVYRALDRQTGQPVALKVLHGHGADHTERFAREARLLSELRHPGIVRFVASGLTNRGEGFIVMEWLDGESLADRLKRGPLSVADGIALGARVADALRPAHERGIVHRDLKPQNLFLEHGALDRIKVLDFGIARVLDPGQKLTITGEMLGTPGYMSPEQAMGKGDVDARTDVYALGCVLFRALTGQRVFAGDDAVRALIRVTREPAPRVSSLRPDVPPALDHLIARMLAIDPAERPRDAPALLAELAVLGGWASGSTFVPPSGAMPRSGPPPSFQPASAHGYAPPTWTSAHAAPALTFSSTAPAHTASSLPSVPMPAHPSAAAPPPAQGTRPAALLLAGAAGALLVLVVLLGGAALLILSVWSRSSSPAPNTTSGAAGAPCPGERCTPARIASATRADPITLLPQARDFARTSARDAELIMLMYTTSNKDGTVDVTTTSNSLHYFFQSGNSRIIVWAFGEQLVLSRGPASTPMTPLPEIGCSTAAIWRAAFPSGLGSDVPVPVTMQLIDIAPYGPVWQIRTATNGYTYVDPRSCAARRLY